MASGAMPSIAIGAALAVRGAGGAAGLRDRATFLAAFFLAGAFLADLAGARLAAFLAGPFDTFLAAFPAFLAGARLAVFFTAFFPAFFAGAFLAAFFAGAFFFAAFFAAFFFAAIFSSGGPWGSRDHEQASQRMRRKGLQAPMMPALAMDALRSFDMKR